MTSHVGIFSCASWPSVCLLWKIVYSGLRHFFNWVVCSLTLNCLICLYNLDVVIQMLSHVWIFATPWTAAHQTSQSFTISRSMVKLMSIESVMPSNHLTLCHPLLFLLSVFPSIRVFSKESALCIWWPHIGALASASVLLMNIQGWFPLGLTVLILQSKGLSRVFSNATVQKHQFFGTQLFL